jgi:LPXTG-motif cell wall-anchored protein
MPGKVTSTTGTVKGNTVTFKGKLGDKLVIEAQADETNDNTLLFVGIGAAILGLLAAAGFLIRKKSTTPIAVSASENTFDSGDGF